MNRREFITRAVPAGTIPFLLGGYSMTAYGRSPFLESLIAAATETDRVLVLVQLNGGNDGLNTVIPLDQYSALSAARSNIMIDSTQVLQLTAATGLHPAMTGMQTLYKNGELVVVQSVSYPTPNFSHFRATDIWLTGADYNQILSTGWLGRYLNDEFPGYPNGYPNTVMPDPLAIQIGSVVSSSLQGSSVSMGLAIANPNSTYITPGGADTPPNTPAGHELTFVREIAQQTQVYSTGIKTAAAKVANKSALYPTAGQNSLADQLRIVARLVAGGLKTRVYIVNIGGFDTHSGQVNSGDHSTGVQATLLGQLSSGITAFLDDLALLGVDDRVIGMTFSEFGRRIKSNASAGTDHGTAAPVFVFGKNVSGGIVGTNPVLPAAATVNDNIPMQFDFRNIYASILKDWFGASPTELHDVLSTPQLPNTQDLPIVRSSAIAGIGDVAEGPREYRLYQNYPNPFNPSTTIRYAIPRGAHVLLRVYATTGQEVATLVDNDQAAGEYSVLFNAGGLASGAYFYTIRAGEYTETRKLLLVR